MGQKLKALGALLAGGALGATESVLGQEAAKKKADAAAAAKIKGAAIDSASTPKKDIIDLISPAPSYSIAHDMRNADADTQTPDTE
jgi:hypothetical protein